MFRSQLRQISLHCERANFGLSTPARQFSCTRTVAGEGRDQPSESRNPNTRPASATPSYRPRKPIGPPARTSHPNGPPARTNQYQSRPPRVIDARSFAAARAGGGEQPKIIRSPRSRNVRGGNQFPNRKPKPSAKAAKAAKGNLNGPRRNAKTSENDEGEDAEAAAIDQVLQEQIIKSRPTPIRYEPQEINYSTLRETWPSIPTDVNSRSAAVYEKLSGLGGRIANGYIPPYELGRRLWKGQSVLFKNETEKAEALEETKRLAQLRADRISQRKGDLVEPRNVEFRPIDAKDTKSLMEIFVQGNYPTPEVGKDGHAVLREVSMNLRNNGTYQTTGKTSQFMAKIESLVSAGRKTKSV
ncbi:C6 finger domain protein [Penicillium digitatum]|uniref:Uncharacterized protein n=3 Tax=Penicillium digitatum TaxID=36651 RepID=K9FX86_PEND2|nr:hypothetical protein PDIP_85560 [Penicillium digitatum Pd1]EKV04963.1 hypothetical protein PDIP_85560 [Penicillium digitatum Pd1]EKV05671.1 hypothetical protein PDIG_82130 [Penicillium digitatum PHI26]KAG0160384.1 hypothetical protein PDIDSM_7911 [Penicillium digitatum]QQK45519.1 C6 finger domain protein [Penicillium digitatum]